MTDLPPPEGSHNQENSESQPLTQIEGIGEAKQQWLESIGIETIQDLANADAGEVESQLEATNHPTSRNIIDSWISQAQRLMEALGGNEFPLEDSSSETPSPESTQVSSEETEQATEAVDTSGAGSEAETGEAEEAAEDLEEEEVWETFASFAVKFEAKQVGDKIQYQTSVRHTETDQTQTWSGLEEENLQTWLRQQMADAVPTSAESTTAEPSESKTWFTPLVEDLRIYQPPLSRNPMEIYKPNLMFPSPVKGNLPFVLEIEFRIQEQDIFSKLEQEVLYEAECYARSLKKGGILTLGHILPKPLNPRDRCHTIRFPAASLQPGIFRLQFLLNLREVHAFPVFFEVPALQVA
jgi:hypothetical protein